MGPGFQSPSTLVARSDPSELGLDCITTSSTLFTRADSLTPCPALKLNGYAKVLVSDRKASNGYFHTLNHPLLPPPSILDELFLFPDFFSTLTSAVQQVHKSWALDWSYDRNKSKSEGKPHFHGAPLATAFTPSNTAFYLLPPKLKFYLFSPYGRWALTKLLAYHYVPETLLLTEFFYSEHKHHHHGAEHFDIGVAGSDDDPSFHKEFNVHTGLHNATIKVEIDKTKFLPVEGGSEWRLRFSFCPILATLWNCAFETR